jgi:cytochrome c5
LKLAITSALLAASLALPAVATAAEPAKPAKSTEKSGDEILSFTCGDLMDLFSAAAPKKGKDPRRLARAQDDVLNFVMWVHGYVSGRDGIDFAKRPLNEQGIKQTVDQMASACQGDPKRLFLDAVKDVK